MRKIGRFAVPASIFRSDNIEPMRALQQKVVVLHFNPEPWIDSVDVVGFCDDFTPVEYGCVTPEYNCSMSIDEDGNHVVEFSKK